MESMSSAEPSTKIASGWPSLRSSTREHVVGRRIDPLGRHPVGVDQRNKSVVGLDDAYRDVAIAAALGDARRQRVGGLLFRNRDDVVQAPVGERVEEGRCSGFGIVCPGNADGVKAVLPDSGEDVVQGVEIDRVAADGGALGRRALDQHPSDVCRRHRQTEYEVHVVCPRSRSIGSEITALMRITETGGKSRADPASALRVPLVPQMDRRNMMLMSGLGLMAAAAAMPVRQAQAMPADRVPAPAAPPDAATGAYIFQDEFDGPMGAGPNPANWTVQSWQDDVWPPVEAIYRDDRRNVFLDGNSNLVLLATRDFGGQLYSGKLRGNWRGMINTTWEARIKLDCLTTGAWPAFWAVNEDPTARR